jgi:lipopolysaccharide transport system permease protein
VDGTYKEQEKRDMIILPERGWFDLHLRDLWRYRDLISLFVKRDFVTFYKQTAFGPCDILFSCFLPP